MPNIFRIKNLNLGSKFFILFFLSSSIHLLLSLILSWLNMKPFSGGPHYKERQTHTFRPLGGPVSLKSLCFAVGWRWRWQAWTFGPLQDSVLIPKVILSPTTLIFSAYVTVFFVCAACSMHICITVCMYSHK
jgi:hypothetical protein